LKLGQTRAGRCREEMEFDDAFGPPYLAVFNLINHGVLLTPVKELRTFTGHRATLDNTLGNATGALSTLDSTAVLLPGIRYSLDTTAGNGIRCLVHSGQELRTFTGHPGHSGQHPW
jgi:hypothetical protein